MNIIPVLDLLGGQVVRGIAGRRGEYRPIISKLTTSSVPLDVAHAMREQFGLSRLYLADLDAIMGAKPALAVYDQLQSSGFQLWVDAGLRKAADATPLFQANVSGVIAGLETMAGPEELQRLLLDHRSEALVFSLDLKQGQPLTSNPRWGHGDALAIARQVISLGVCRLIVLDLAQVGTNGGVSTQALCATILQENPDVHLITGGGVRGLADLFRLKKCGVHSVLIASALHDGKLAVEELRSL